jgi:hypothetical protein
VNSFSNYSFWQHSYTGANGLNPPYSGVQPYNPYDSEWAVITPHVFTNQTENMINIGGMTVTIGRDPLDGVDHNLYLLSGTVPADNSSNNIWATTTNTWGWSPATIFYATFSQPMILLSFSFYATSHVYLPTNWYMQYSQNGHNFYTIETGQLDSFNTRILYSYNNLLSLSTYAKYYRLFWDGPLYGGISIDSMNMVGFINLV